MERRLQQRPATQFARQSATHHVCKTQRSRDATGRIAVQRTVAPSSLNAQMQSELSPSLDERRVPRQAQHQLNPAHQAANNKGKQK
jgi:hypothetical protein